ncbi:hypothetical protein FHU13_004921 [Methylobacterium sp. R2-1]|nr:hypothetical protein [Methylobacterium sp. R2-1]
MVGRCGALGGLEYPEPTRPGMEAAKPPRIAVQARQPWTSAPPKTV